MKKSFSWLILYSIVMAIFVNLTGCSQSSDLTSDSSKLGAQLASVVLKVNNIETQDIKLKSTSVDDIINVRVTNQWGKAQYDSDGTVLTYDELYVNTTSANFIQYTEAYSNFVNPVTSTYNAAINLPYILEGNNRFMLEGTNVNGKIVAIGQVYKLIDPSTTTNIDVDLYTIGSKLAFNISDLKNAGIPITFNWSYSKYKPIFNFVVNSGTTLPMTTYNVGTADEFQRPVWDMKSKIANVEGNLVVNGNTVTLNDEVLTENPDVVVIFEDDESFANDLTLSYRLGASQSTNVTNTSIWGTSGTNQTVTFTYSNFNSDGGKPDDTSGTLNLNLVTSGVINTDVEL